MLNNSPIPALLFLALIVWVMWKIFNRGHKPGGKYYKETVACSKCTATVGLSGNTNTDPLVICIASLQDWTYSGDKGWLCPKCSKQGKGE